MLVGHWIEMRSISQAQGALRALAKLLPDTAIRVVGDRTEEVPLNQLRNGDLVLVRPGARIPVDGVVREGSSEVNESMITGESRPIPRKAGDKVIAGTVNGAGSLRVEVTGVGERTVVAGIMRLVEQAQASRSRAQALADRAAFILTLVALRRRRDHAGRLARRAIRRPLIRRRAGRHRSRDRVPHALGLAIPLVIAISTDAGRPERPARPQSPAPGRGAEPERGRLRQDRHSDEGRVRRR